MNVDYFVDEAFLFLEVASNVVVLGEQNEYDAYMHEYVCLVNGRVGRMVCLEEFGEDGQRGGGLEYFADGSVVFGQINEYLFIHKTNRHINKMS